MNGNIPKNLTLYVSNPKKIELKYEDSDISYGKSIDVNETFISDSDNVKTCDTGKKWAENNRLYDHSKRESIKLGYTVETMPNNEISDVKITGLEHRGQGGRAYKVIVNGKYYVDLREDILLETILNVGIDSGGKLKGKYIWGKVGSSMKLIRSNSALHEELLKSTEMNLLKKISSLQVGTIYQSKTETLLYIGKFKTVDMQLQYPNYDTIGQHKKQENLFYDMDNYQSQIKDNFNGDVKTLKYSKFIFKKNHTLKLDTGLKVILQPNFIDLMKAQLVEHYNNRPMSDVENHKIPNMPFHYYSSRFMNTKTKEQYYSLCQYSGLLNINEIHPIIKSIL